MNIPVLTKFLPETLFKINSPINGEISVVEQFGKRKIMVGGLTQSGPMAEEVWEKAIKLITSESLRSAKQFFSESKRSFLILGLGGGSLVKLVNQYLPGAKIIGVEIDPLMIDLGKKYLNLLDYNNLEIKISNAKNFVCQTKKRRSFFDLIFVDLYLGDKIPQSCQTNLFLQNLKKIMNKNGVLVFNRLYYKNHIFEADNFLDKLKKIFNDLVCKKVLTNLLVLARR